MRCGQSLDATSKSVREAIFVGQPLHYGTIYLETLSGLVNGVNQGEPENFPSISNQTNQPKGHLRMKELLLEPQTNKLQTPEDPRSDSMFLPSVFAGVTRKVNLALSCSFRGKANPTRPAVIPIC